LLVKGNQRGEVEVATDGKVIEALKWTSKGATEEEEGEEGEEGRRDGQV